MAIQTKLTSRFVTVISLFAVLFPLNALADKVQAAETFSVNGNKALNTNYGFRRFDGEPRMSIFQRNDNDPDQQFDRLNGNLGGTLLKHRTTGKCLNAHYLSNGAEINVWGCNGSDPDQNWDMLHQGNGVNLIQRRGTNLCVDSPTRNDVGKVHLWTCDANNANQRFQSSQGGETQKAEEFFRWANGQYSITRLDRSDLNGQCATLIMRYMQEVFLNRSTANRAYGHGKDVASGVATQHSNFFEPVTTQGLPKRGAVISFKSTGAYMQWGHVGIVMESRYVGAQRQIKLMDSNGDGNAPNTKVRVSDWIDINSVGGTLGWTNPR